MSGHLPECPVPEMDGLWGLPLHPEDAEANCFCDRLRACEQRVNGHRLSYENGVEVGYNKGYVAGLDAAREAVERVSSLLQPLGPALAAIDALREEQK